MIFLTSIIFILNDIQFFLLLKKFFGQVDFYQIKAKEKFKAHETKQIVFSILGGLREMHGKKIMHRDLKPENIIFRTPGSSECVIADFGLA